MECPNYYPLVSSSESESINPCFISILFFAINALSLIIGLYQLCQIKYKVGSLAKQSFSYKLKIAIFVVYNLSLVLYAWLIKESKLWFYAVLTNLTVNLLILLPLLVVEVLFSIIPHGILLYSGLIQFVLFTVLTVQSITGGDLFIHHKFVQYVTSISAFAIFVLELLYYTPSVELNNYFLSNNLPTNIPNAMNRLTFSYMNPMVVRNYNNPDMSVQDLEDIVPELESDNNFTSLSRSWFKQERYHNKSLIYALLESFGMKALAAFLFLASKSILTYTQPQLFRLLIAWINDESKSFLLKFLICLGMLFCALLQTICYNSYLIRMSISGNALKYSLMRLIYNKAMRLSPEAKAEKSTGKIISLISVDTSIIFGVFMHSMTSVVIYPTEIVICLVSLYFLLGNAMWSGLAIMIVVIPINSKIMNSMKFLQQRHLVRKDTRTSLVSDILNSIKSIKLYAWETPMLLKLDKVRNEEELADLKQKGILDSFAKLLSSYVPYLICCSSFYIYSKYNDIPLTAEIIFPSIALFDLLGEPVHWLPDAISDLIEFRISVNRVKEFMLLDELDRISSVNKETDGGDLQIKNTTFFWSKKEQKIALKDINYSVSKGQLSCIVGKVGSGKSAFLKSILGELPLTSSDPALPPIFEINGSIAYCAQMPWIMNSTVKENILFNHEFDELFYNLVIECCDLAQDIATFEDQDETLVGEKGITLSGGQQLRLSLARALYARADIYIFDDILSAVDSHVSAHLIAKVFNKNGGLLAGKTTILATNNVKVLNSADEIILLEDHTIAERGSYNDIIKDDKSKLANLIKNFGTVIDQAELEKFEPIEEIKEPKLVLQDFDKVTDLSRLTHDNNNKTHKSHEKSLFGKVDWSVYIAYAKSCGRKSVIFTTFLVFLTPFFEFSDNYWLKHWSEINEQNGANTDVNYYIGIFVLIALGIGLSSCIKDIFLTSICAINSAKKLHHDLAYSLLRAPMQFFDTTPVGRILNRFTGDINNVDKELSVTFDILSYEIVNIMVVAAVISFNLPIFLLLFVVLFFVYRYYQDYYVALSREVKRMLSISRSPIVSQIGEAINGDETVRAFNQLSRFDYFLSLLLDNNVRVIYNNTSFARWVAVRLEFIGAFVIFSVAVLSVLSQMSSHPLSSALVGLIMSYSLKITIALNAVVRISAQCEAEIVSVERILEYCELPSEKPLVIENHRTPLNWPSKGDIEFKNYSTSYKEDLKPVLKNLNFKINSQEKIGVVGRTGAGKSTMALSIFRLLEPTEGSITIDDVVINDIGLFDLRHNLNIIPQNSQALQGTIKSNLDPLSQYTDEQLLHVLDISHFQKFIKSEEAPEGNILDYAISENGSNLSVGQKQLLCLARALLNPSKILILDEATAAVDVETDKIIQETIRSKFNDRTIITIAHRLDTILDYDKVLVLDNGEVKEFDKVGLLLDNKDSLFYKMCEKGGYL